MEDLAYSSNGQISTGYHKQFVAQVEDRMQKAKKISKSQLKKSDPITYLTSN